MNLETTKRGRHWRVDGNVGGKRLRISLGTENGDYAEKCKNKIESALQGGASSQFWPELKVLLPPQTFRMLAKIGGYEEKQNVVQPTWTDLEGAFSVEMQQRILLGKLAASTRERYRQTFRAFVEFLKTGGVTDLGLMNRSFIEKFKVWRLERIYEKKFSRGGRGLALDIAILHRIFAFAVESEMVEKNPVRLDGRPGDNPEAGAQPFDSEALGKLRTSAGPDLLPFLLLRWTGLRGSDAVKLTWQEVSFDRKEIERVTQKRKKRVILPINAELLFALEAEYDRLKPVPTDRVLNNPGTGQPMKRPRLYQRMLALGKRAGVPNSHPHRFRDTLAVDMLQKGASPYDVAKILGDTIDTVERHYAPFTKELRDRVRRIMENGEGLEKISGTFWAHSSRAKEKTN